jgi:5-methylcytosine-specific restriction endonuclease McrA
VTTLTAEAIFERNYKHWKRRIAKGEHIPLNLSEIEQERESVRRQIAEFESRIAPLAEMHAECEQSFIKDVWESQPWWRRVLPRPTNEKLLDLGREQTPESLKRLADQILDLRVKACPLRHRLRELEMEESFIQALAEETKRDAVKQREIAERRQQLDRRRALQEQKRKQLEEEQESIRALAAQFDRHQFLIRNKDYKRGNAVDNFIRRELLDDVLNAFSQRCAVCGNSSSLVLDHFGIPKNEGGNFVLYDHVAQSYTLNVAVLCQSCNSAKGERPFYEVLSQTQIEEVERIHVSLLPQLLGVAAFRKALAKWYEIDLLGDLQIHLAE